MNRCEKRKGSKLRVGGGKRGKKCDDDDDDDAYFQIIGKAVDDRPYRPNVAAASAAELIASRTKTDNHRNRRNENNDDDDDDDDEEMVIFNQREMTATSTPLSDAVADDGDDEIMSTETSLAPLGQYVDDPHKSLVTKGALRLMMSDAADAQKTLPHGIVVKVLESRIMDGGRNVQMCVTDFDEQSSMFVLVDEAARRVVDEEHHLSANSLIQIMDYEVEHVPVRLTESELEARNRPVVFVKEAVEIDLKTTERMNDRHASRVNHMPAQNLVMSISYEGNYEGSAERPGSGSPKFSSPPIVETFGAAKPPPPPPPPIPTKPRTFTQIAALGPRSVRWTLRVRVFAKSDIVNWNNVRSTGTRFSFDVCDRSGELRLVAFDDQCSKFFLAVQVGSIYIITGGTIQLKNQKFNHLEGEFEIRLDKSAQILDDTEGDQDDVPLVYGHFINVRQLLEKIVPPSLNSCPSQVDIVLVTGQNGSMTSGVSSRTGKAYEFRKITVFDDSVTQTIELTLWNEEAKMEFNNNEVLVLKNARVERRDDTVGLSKSHRTTMLVDPEIPRVRYLKNWTEKFLVSRNQRQQSDQEEPERDAAVAGPQQVTGLC